MKAPATRTICYLAGSSGDWGGASRVLFTNLEILDRERYRPLVLLPRPGPIEERLRRLDIKYEIWGDDREPGSNKLRYPLELARTVKFFRRNRIDLLHINHAGYWRPAEIVAARVLGIPVVTHYHRNIDEHGPFIALSSLIAAVSHYTARTSKPRKVPKVVIHNSVDLRRFDRARDIRADLGIAPSDIVVAFVGQVRLIKGIDLFVDMAHRIEGRSVKFLVVGECRDPAKFEGSYTEAQLHAAIGSDRRIAYVGYRSDVENVYRSSDVIVVPSRFQEPFGLVNIEAGAAGKPVVATNEGGIPEVVRHGCNGFLVERDDLVGFARHTQTLVDNADLRGRMGNAGRKIVGEEFTAAPVRKLEQIYDALIDRNSEVLGKSVVRACG